MSIAKGNDKKLHYDLTNVGLRAQATAAGLVQLCIELRLTGMLEEIALERIKTAIADEILICTPRTVDKPGYRRDVRNRLDRLFSGVETIGSGEEIVTRVHS